jgi:cytochrome c553
MKSATLVFGGAAAALILGCAHPERSRNLANPAVAATTLAQQVCSNCHGLTGNAVSPNFPNLAGQMPAYLSAQLKAFKSHDRLDPAGFEYMWGLSRSLSDEQIDGLAAYYAGQTPLAVAAAGDPGRVAAGKAVFDNGVAAASVPACASCHGPQARGAGTFPRLAGQHADYIAKQLRVFQRTDERPEGSIMKTVAHNLTPGNIDDVAVFLEALATP